MAGAAIAIPPLDAATGITYIPLIAPSTPRTTKDHHMNSTTTAPTATRPYGFHSNCDHDATKGARRACRNHTRNQLRDERIAELRNYAAMVELDNRAKARKDDLVYRLSFSPAIRETFSIYA